MSEYVKPFLKWAGGKYASLDKILPHIYRYGRNQQLIVPFLGGGAVYMNAEGFSRYVVADVNPLLSNVWARFARGREPNVLVAREYFRSGELAGEAGYYKAREMFNQMAGKWWDTGRVNGVQLDVISFLFLFLNRHGYRGLTRFNKSGQFNVPYGNYADPYFPDVELFHFIRNRADLSDIGYGDFEPTMYRAKPGDIVFADPPYHKDGGKGFTSYYRGKFDIGDHIRLDNVAAFLARDRDTVTIICGYDSAETRALYQSCDFVVPYMTTHAMKKSAGKKVGEALYIYEPAGLSEEE